MSTPLRERPDAPLGTLIFRAGLLPAETIESALQESSRTGKRLGEILLERKLLEETQLSRLLAGQKGLPFVTLRERGVDVDAAKFFTEDQARLYRALPFQVDSGTPVVAISDPTNEVVMRNIREALDGTEVQFAVATKSELTELMGEIYNPNGHQNGNGYANGNGSGTNGASAVYETPVPAAVVAEPEPVEAVPAEAAELPPEADVLEPLYEPVVEPAPEPVAEPLPEPEPVAIEPLDTPEPELPALPESPPIQEVTISDPEPVEAVLAEAAELLQEADVVEPLYEPVVEPAPEAVAEPLPEPEPVAIEPLDTPELPALPEPPPIQEVTISDPVEQPSLHQPEPEPQAPPEPAVTEPAPFQVAPAPMPEPAPLRVAPPLESAPAQEPKSPVGSATIRVVIRLSNNDRVDAAVVGDPRAAKAQAQALIRYIAGKDGGDWPYVAGRFLKPDAIVSVDLVEQIPGETGSAA